MADYAQIIAAGVEATPVDYTVPNAQEIIPLAVRAVFDGTNALGDFIPVVEFVSDGGVPMATATGDDTISAGASGEVSFFPFGRKSGGSAGVASAWCQVTIGVQNTAPNTFGGVALTFTHMITNDTTVFATSVGTGGVSNQPGDDHVFVQKPGIVLANWHGEVSDPTHGALGRFFSPDGFDPGELSAANALPVGTFLHQSFAAADDWYISPQTRAMHLGVYAGNYDAIAKAVFTGETAFNCMWFSTAIGFDQPY